MTKWRRHRPGPVGLAIWIGLLAALAFVLTPAGAPSVEGEVSRLLSDLGLQVPSREMAAPDFSLPSVSGAPIRLSDYRDRPVMLYFWTTY
jgi:AhpC/TSA family